MMIYHVQQLRGVTPRWENCSTHSKKAEALTAAADFMARLPHESFRVTDSKGRVQESRGERMEWVR